MFVWPVTLKSQLNTSSSLQTRQQLLIYYVEITSIVLTVNLRKKLLMLNGRYQALFPSDYHYNLISNFEIFVF